MNGFSKFGLAVAGSLVVASAAMAQGGPPDPNVTAVKARQGLFEVINFTFGPAAASLRPGGAPIDGAAAQKIGERLEFLAPLIPEVFARDTHGASGLTTKARDAIWTSKSDFESKANDLAKAAAAMVDAGKSGDAAAIKKATIGIGQACGGCHKAFKDS